MDRRSFFKRTAGVAAAAAAMSTLDMKAWAQKVEDGPVEIKGNMCKTCASHCGMDIHVKNGRIWKVTGQPQHTSSRGKLCPRAHGGLYWVYDPDRVKTPLKRVGEGEFEAISWDQATTEIAERFQAVLDQYGPQAAFVNYHHFAHATSFWHRLMYAKGVNTLQTHNAACNTARGKGVGAVWGGALDADWANSKYLLFIGRNMAEGIRTGTTTAFAKAIERGAKVVCVDPRLSEGGALNDWVPIKPGTDLALLLAISNVLITEDLYDKAFVAEHTNGFEELAAAVQDNTPEWAAEITDIPAAKIREIARGLAEAAPAAAVDTSWKGAFPAKPSGPRGDGVGTEFPLGTSHGLPHLSMQKAVEGKVKAGFIWHTNPLRNFPDYEHMLAGYRALDLLVVVETHMSETAMQAHYILPEASFGERNDVVETKGTTIATRVPAVAKIHPETKEPYEIVQMLAQKMGVGEYFDFTLDEWNAARISNQDFTLDELKAVGSIEVKVEQPKGFQGLGTSSGKAEFFSKPFADNGFGGIARWHEPETGLAMGRTEFRLVHGKQAYHAHTHTSNIPLLAQVTKDLDSARVWINASRAAELGIADGDSVRFTSKEDGRYREARVKVTERIHPDMLFMGGVYGPRTPYFQLAETLGGFNANDISKYRLDPTIGHTMMNELIVQVQKA
ncbi:MAG: molybdopterin-dependent oxidoreductase [Spirochaeta sp.]|nr:molybdopterin-dependent oxidoreductase [Spirochaeta sp.]